MTLGDLEMYAVWAACFFLGAFVGYICGLVGAQR